MASKKNLGSILGQYWVVAVIGMVLVVLFAWWQAGSGNTLQPTAPTKTFKSTLTDFSLQVPVRFDIEEKVTRVIMTYGDVSIFVDRHATDFDDLDSYLADLDSVNKVKVVEDKKMNISSYESYRRVIELGTGERQLLYNIYVDGSIYTIFTDSSALYDDLDQMARSFRYPPD